MTVAQLKELRAQKKSSYNYYVSRRDDVKSIVSKVESSFDDEIKYINNKTVATVLNLGDGLSGVSCVSTIKSKLNDCTQCSVETDTYLSSTRNYLDMEQMRCQSCINTLAQEIEEIETQIKNQGGSIWFWE